MAFWLADAARVFPRVGLEEELRGVLTASGGPTRWHEVALALLAGEPSRAAGVYREIGSRPDEADARLAAAAALIAAGRRPEGEAELREALAFYRSVGAAAYVREAEALLAASA